MIEVVSARENGSRNESINRQVTMRFVARVKDNMLKMKGTRVGARVGAVIGELSLVVSMEDAKAPHTASVFSVAQPNNVRVTYPSPQSTSAVVRIKLSSPSRK